MIFVGGYRLTQRKEIKIMTFEKINVGAGTVTPTYVNCNCSNATNATKNFSTSHGHCSNKS